MNPPPAESFNRPLLEARVTVEGGDSSVTQGARAMPYRPAIDGLRAVAVLSVFLFHLDHKFLPGGFVGVDVFFVISGYLITSIILKDCKSGQFSLAKFYQRRIARIFPASFAVALSILAFAFFIYTPQDLASTGANLTAATLSVINMKYMSQGNYFIISPDAQPFLHYWSLSVEEQFYMFFPVTLFLIFKFAGRYKVMALGLIGIVSLIACVILTTTRPAWAFYLLPARAWELVAGCLLSVIFADTPAAGAHPWFGRIPVLGLGLVLLSFVIVREGPQFPGCWAILPVLGAVCVLIPAGHVNRLSERLLAVPPLVIIGRMSYSIYLWHWPIFSLVDYKLFLASGNVRLALKIGLSLLAASLSYWFIENPARVFLNRGKNRPVAYASLVAGLAVCVPLGIAVRKANYVNAEFADVTRGGLVFYGKSNGGSVLLMGDSNGSMYGKAVKEICGELGRKLTVISAAAGDPLPSSDGNQNRLWLDSLAVVQREKPEFLILAYRWEVRLDGDKGRIALALDALKPFVGRIILLNQPPVLPGNASRISIRAGARPPFYEDSRTHQIREEDNRFLRSFSSNKVFVVDIASHFEKPDGEIIFLDESGRQLYQDAGHLSGDGANLIKGDIIAAISGVSAGAGSSRQESPSLK